MNPFAALRGMVRDVKAFLALLDGEPPFDRELYDEQDEAQP